MVLHKTKNEIKGNLLSFLFLQQLKNLRKYYKISAENKRKRKKIKMNKQSIEIENQKQYIKKMKEINDGKNLKYTILTMGCQLN